jgi:hypothetical protein
MMELVKGILSTVNGLLAHFHYALKGQFPFSLEWKLDKGPKIAELSHEQHKFVKFIAIEVKKKGMHSLPFESRGSHGCQWPALRNYTAPQNMRRIIVLLGSSFSKIGYRHVQSRKLR